MTEPQEYIQPIQVNYQDELSEFALSVVIDNRKEIWKHYIQYLSEEESQLLQNQKTTEAKNSFCLGKFAAKKAVSYFSQTPLNTLTINHGVFGFPVVHPVNKGMQVSIAHTAYSGIALGFNEKYPVGVDMELLDATHNTTIRTTFTGKELQLAGGVQETLYCHIIWSAKEALSKAIKTGFLLHLPLLEIKSIAPKENFYKVEFEHFSLFTGIVFQLKEYIIALVVPTRLTINTEFVNTIQKQSNQY